MHIILWEFVVHPGKVHEFVLAYGPNGDWAQLFRLATGYKGTELLASTSDANKFVTIDRWNNLEDYARFQNLFGQQYRSLDARLEGLTLSETNLGHFTTQ